MTLLVLVILAVIWAAVLLPPWLQSRSESRPADSISTFRNQLSVLERRSTLSVPGQVLPARSTGGQYSPYGGRAPGTRVRVDQARLARMEAKRRRRDILVTLLAAAGLTLAIGLLMPVVLYFHLLIDALLVAYVALLVRQRRIAEERSTKVRYLAPSAPARAAHAYRSPAQPALALRRSAAN